MDRRVFLNDTGYALLAATFAELPFSVVPSVLSGPSGAKSKPTPPSRTTHLLGQTVDPDRVADLYETGAKELGPSAAPYVYAYYDESAKRFLNPLASDAKGVKPVLEKGSYTLTPVLKAFNIKQSELAQFQNLKNQLQLSFNASAPLNAADRLSWIFMNAVDVFLAKDDKGRQDQLTKFTSAQNTVGASLDSQPKITVDKGLVTLQVTAFGQKQDSLWTRIFDVVVRAAGAPLVSTALKGFGVPALVTEAVTFVDSILHAVALQNKLVTLWQTGGLEFAVTKDVSARFNMAPGLWLTVDASYARDSNFLEGHTVDLEFQSFRMSDPSKKAVDANYLVADIRLPKA